MVDYRAVLQPHKQAINKSFKEWVPKASVRNCVCWMMALVRSERFCGGSTRSSVADGSVVSWLNRVEELVKDKAVNVRY
ncbi:hypothetical protein I3271_07595 [Photobacterium leiognathi]|nr:hypothetical protein [Photobacterium leiognathi]